MVILVSGKSGSGVTSFSEALRSYWGNRGIACWRYSMTEPLQEMAKAVYLVGGHYGITSPPEGAASDLDLVKMLEHDWGHKKDPAIWINTAKSKMRQVTDRWEELGFFYIVILEDVFYPSQFDAWPDALSIRLECASSVRFSRLGVAATHTEHPSEAALDSYVHQGRFDIVLNSATSSVEEMVQQMSLYMRDTLDQAFSKKGSTKKGLRSPAEDGAKDSTLG